MRRRAFVPSALPRLEERIALSHAAQAHAALVAPVVHQTSVLDLNGFALGTDTTFGTIHVLQATGANISPLGQTNVVGFLVIGPGTKTEPANGFVMLSNAKGAILVSLSGTVMPLGGPLKNFSSGQLAYNIIGGTGAYAGDTGHGKVGYGPGPALLSGRFLLVFGNAVPPP
jgi:hypothetical protein